jgi:hypothetical protein
MSGLRNPGSGMVGEAVMGEKVPVLDAEGEEEAGMP